MFLMRQLITNLFARRQRQTGGGHSQNATDALSLAEWADLPAYHPACPEPRCA